MRIAFKICRQWVLALLNFQKVCLKSLLFLVIKSYKKVCKRMKKQLLHSIVAKHHDLSVARRLIICRRHRLIIDLLANDKSRYFAQRRPIIDEYPRYKLLFFRHY